ncbi:acyltransferase-like protein [Roseibium hamelinense]|uniref:Acyltransferase-like protein n=1 Tax=Roseibium hamelinense TaxID=150831 RepID=A0A562TGF6_9HYPH|nr:acyltransferase [Roseibium hamelinense]TWI92651.1 acyltransferase-like protein [Roseibium hamelinense]
MAPDGVALAIAGLGATQVWEAVANLFLLHAWIPRDTAFFSINNPSWSLSAEMFFYAMFPFAIPLVNRLRKTAVLPVMLGLVAVILSMPLLAGMLPSGEVFGSNHAQSPLLGASILQVWSVYAFPPVRLLEFVAGMLAARAVREALLPHLPIWLGLAAVALSYAGSLFVPLLWQVDAIFVLPVLVLIVAAAQTASRPALLASPLAVRMGEISFALYLVHDIILGVGRNWLGPVQLTPTGAVVFIAGLFAVSLVAALALWRYVEVPSNNYLRSLSFSQPRKLEA